MPTFMPICRRAIAGAAGLALAAGAGCAGFPPPPPSTSQALARAAEQVQVVVHRAGPVHAPENTLAALRQSVLDGADVVEADIRTSADGVLYVIHDARLERTTDGRGAVASSPSAYLDELDAGFWFHPRFAGEPLPRLRAFLRELSPQVGIYCDVKAAAPAAVHRLLVETGMDAKALVGFGDIRQTAAFSRMDSRARVKISARSVADLDRTLDRVRAHVVEVRPGDLTPELITRLRAHGLELMIPVWRNDPAAYRAALAWGADWVNVEHPAEFRRVAAELAGATAPSWTGTAPTVPR